MPLMSKPSSEARIAIIFVTAGALTIVWTAVWFAYMHNEQTAPPWEQYVCTGALLSGIVVLVIGLALGRIARAARQAEMPPEEITSAEHQISQEAAAHAPIVVPTGLSTAAVSGANPAAPVGRVIAANPANPANPVNPGNPPPAVNSKTTATF